MGILLKAAAEVTSNVLMLYLLIAAGFACDRVGMITRRGAKQMTDLLLIVVTPCVIISAFQIKFSREYAFGFLISISIAVVMQVTGILASRFPFRGYPAEQKSIMRYATIYSNCGFMSIPLTTALLQSAGLDSVGVFFGSSFIAVSNIFMWTQGIYLITGDKGTISLKKAFLSPGIIGIIAALPLFLLSVKLPGTINGAVTHIKNLNTPLAMIIIGIYISRTNLLDAFKDKRIYSVAALRLLLVPAVVFALLSLFVRDRAIFIACLVPSSAPVAGATTLFATKFGGDAELASKLMAVTTLFSIITMPLFIILANLVLPA